MKKTISKDVHFCDSCTKELDYPTKCMGCSNEYCYECRKTKCVDYPHGVYFSGTGDGLYCKPCDDRLGQIGDKRILAYRKIQTLRKESEAWGEDFNHRKNEAESELLNLR